MEMITAWSLETWVLPGKEVLRVLVSWGKEGIPDHHLHVILNQVIVPRFSKGRGK